MKGDVITYVAAALPPPETIRRTAEEVLQRPYFKLEPASYNLSLYQRILGFFARILGFLARLFRPIGSAFAALYAVSPFLAWLFVIVLLLVAAALIVHIVYSFKKALEKRKEMQDFSVLEEKSVDEPEGWEERAREAAGNADYISALRFLFRASLLRLERARERPFKRAATNREYLRRFRETPAYDPLSFFVDMIDVKWYGGGECTEEHYEQGTHAHVLIRNLERELAHVDGT
jgi:hypothetical protein